MNLRCNNCHVVTDMKTMQRCPNCNGQCFKSGYNLDGSNAVRRGS